MNNPKPFDLEKWASSSLFSTCSSSIVSENSKLNFIYATDDYPRDGCELRIGVGADGYHLGVFDPTGRPLEGYATVKSPAAISRMVREWCEGLRPNLRGEGD